MRDIAAAILFAGFVLAALRLWRPASPERHRQRVNELLAVVLIGSVTVGLTQRDLWPFSSWPLVAGTLEDDVTFGRLLGVDATGQEHDIDFRAWHPFAFDELMSWLDFEYPRLNREAQRDAGAALLRLAESARARTRAGARIDEIRRFFGPAAAPYFILHPRRWTDPSVVPAGRFERLRYVRETWRLSVGRKQGVDRRTVVFEVPVQ